MGLHFFSASKLVEDLAHERVPLRGKAYYMLAGLIFPILVGYSTLTASNAGHSWLGLCEFLLLIVTTVYGFERCYSASNGDGGRFFISDFVCLSLPIGVTTTLVASGIYWGGWALYQYVLLSASFKSERAAKTLVWLNNELPWVTVLITMVVSNGVFYLRMVSHLKRLKYLRQGK